MAIIILAAFFGTLLCAFAGTGRYGLRQSAVYAATLYTLCLVFATEFFSIWNILGFETLFAFWMGLTIVAGLYLYFYGNRQAVLHTFNGAWVRFRASKALWAVTLVWAIILAIALVYPPNNWDSIVYHMARVASWIQQGSIKHFPTLYLPQISYPPLAEWHILHFQLLAGSDRFANTVQWLALVGCGIAASLIARELKQAFSVQVLALVIATTLPMGGLLQGSSTQNDLVVSFWLLAFALFALQYLRKPSVSRLSFCGLALGFALLTKGTAYVFFPPLATMLLLYGIIHTQGKRPRLKVVSAAMVILAIALLLNGGHWVRNWSLFENPLYTGGFDFSNGKLNITILWSNLVHNSALHWGTPSHRINIITLDILYRILGDLTAIPEFRFDGHNLRIPFSKHEDSAGNFLHYWFLVTSLLGVVLFRRRFQLNIPTVYLALSIVLLAIFYCSIVKYQIWSSRTHTPLFMIGAPIISIFIFNLGTRMRDHFTKIFLIMSIPWIFLNETRPFYLDNSQAIFSVNREESYFYYFPHLLRPYGDALFYLKEHAPEEIGINSFHHEYSLRIMINDRLEEPPRMGHVSIGNISSGLRVDGYTPQYILSTDGVVGILEGASYRIVWISPEVIVSAREDIASKLVSGMFEGDTLIVESNYDVYVRDNALLYVKEPCGQEDVEATFFVHVVPVDVDDLADHRRQYGVDNLDFRFEEHGWRSGDRCLAARRLPAYAIRHVETGQYGTDGGRLWSGSIPFDRDPESR